ncbi:hypothetical protein SDC9_131093 [bioreactor metagenome]|uniref:Uncharacterized protein n=1 Tax=bioreactor metagenome TaxID=1076179 RepID=A0A645D4X7_9ZZZZ
MTRPGQSSLVDQRTDGLRLVVCVERLVHIDIAVVAQHENLNGMILRCACCVILRHGRVVDLRDGVGNRAGVRRV